jgi:tetratricopeptide (TPR) repeat protein
MFEFIDPTRNTHPEKGQRQLRELAVAPEQSAEYKERVRLCSLPVKSLPIVMGALWLCALAGCATFQGARLYERGTEALDRGDTSGAIADLERAAQLVPQSSEIQNHLGLARAAAGQDDAALGAFRRAVELDCSNEAAQQNLAAAEARRARLAPRVTDSARGAGQAP